MRGRRICRGNASSRPVPGGVTLHRMRCLRNRFLCARRNTTSNVAALVTGTIAGDPFGCCFMAIAWKVAAKKFHSVAIVANDTALFNSPLYYMMPRSRCVKSRSSWHLALLSFAFQKLPAHIVCFLTAKYNLLHYCTASPISPSITALRRYLPRDSIKFLYRFRVISTKLSFRLLYAEVTKTLLILLIPEPLHVSGTVWVQLWPMPILRKRRHQVIETS